MGQSTSKALQKERDALQATTVNLKAEKGVSALDHATRFKHLAEAAQSAAEDAITAGHFEAETLRRENASLKEQARIAKQMSDAALHGGEGSGAFVADFQRRCASAHEATLKQKTGIKAWLHHPAFELAGEKAFDNMVAHIAHRVHKVRRDRTPWDHQCGFREERGTLTKRGPRR